jgi:hypothetical protein
MYEGLPINQCKGSVKDDSMRLIRSLTLTVVLFGTLTLSVSAQEATSEPLELVETFTDETIPVQFNYPEGWVTNATDEASIYVANSDEALSRSFGDEVENGMVNILVGALPLTYLNAELELNLEAGAKPRQVVQALVDQALSELPEAPDTLFGEVEDITINGQRAATITTGIEDYFGGRLWLKQLEPDVFVAVQLITEYDEVSDWEATALAILDTIQYGETGETLELTETVTSQNGKVTFNYPTDWETIYESSEDSTAIVANGMNAFAYTIGDEIPSGAVSMLVGGYSAAEIREELNVTEEITAGIVLETVTDMLRNEDQPDWTISDVESMTVDDQPAATVTISGEGFADQNWVIEIEPGIFAFVSLLAAPDELADWTSTALAIGKTVTYTE